MRNARNKFSDCIVLRIFPYFVFTRKGKGFHTRRAGEQASPLNAPHRSTTINTKEREAEFESIYFYPFPSPKFFLRIE